VKITAVDLFCGGGGTSSGLALACRALKAECELIAINHWTIAIETHKANHPWATHYCESVERLDPLKVVPSGRLKILVASPECKHHSVAMGGRPLNDQTRATAWHILKWAQELYVENILIENVKEFKNWGPLGADGRPLKSQAGKTFDAFIQALESFDYRVEHRVLNAADFGDATSRERLFILARRPAHKRIVWPEQSHAKDARAPDLFRKVKPWRAAKEIIDWSLPGESIFSRKKPLARSTMERISAGLKKFCGAAAEPFLVILRQHMGGRSIKDPLPTIAAGGQHIALAEPQAFLVSATHGGGTGRRAHSVKEPLKTVTSAKEFALVQPQAFILPQNSSNKPRSTDAPLPVITTTSRGIGVVQPFIVGVGGPQGAGKPKSIERPLGTVMAEDHKGIAEPFIIGMEHSGKNGNGHHGKVAYLIPVHHGKGDRRSFSLHRPMPTITTVDAWGLVEPYLVKFYKDKKSQNQSIHEPLHTVTCKDRHGLAQPRMTEVGLDIRFRMLRPHELAAAMGFPKTYKFAGNREEQVRQVGNAVAVKTARALCKAMIED